jgi:4-hydroxy-tetrahydrodipicolinate synthase
MTAATQLRIAKDLKNIIGTKEASGDFNQVMQIIKNRPEGFLVISGDDLVTLPMIACGGDGVISVVANAYPYQFSELVRLALAGKYDDARRLHYQLNDIINSMFAEGSPSGVKAYLSELGLCRNFMRMPVWPVSESLHENIRGLMKQVK